MTIVINKCVLTSVILTLRQKQEAYHKFKASMMHIVKPYLKTMIHQHCGGRDRWISPKFKSLLDPVNSRTDSYIEKPCLKK